MRFCCYHSPDNYRLCRTIEIKSPVPDRKGTWNQIHSTPITLHSNVTGQLGNWSLGSVSQDPRLNSRLKCTLSWHFIRTYSGTRQAIELLIRWLWMFPCGTVCLGREVRVRTQQVRFRRGGERRREEEGGRKGLLLYLWSKNRGHVTSLLAFHWTTLGVVWYLLCWCFHTGWGSLCDGSLLCVSNEQQTDTCSAGLPVAARTLTKYLTKFSGR